MHENEVAKEIVDADAAYHVHTNLGPGLLESVYEIVLKHEEIPVMFLDLGLPTGCMVLIFA